MSWATKAVALRQLNLQRLAPVATALGGKVRRRHARRRRGQRLHRVGPRRRDLAAGARQL